MPGSRAAAPSLLCTDGITSSSPSIPKKKKTCCLWLLAVEDLHESLAKLDVEGGVDNGVDSTVDIAQPREGTVHGRGDVAVAVHVQDVSDEEGEPADDENTWRGGKKERGGV